MGTDVRLLESGSLQPVGRIAPVSSGKVTSRRWTAEATRADSAPMSVAGEARISVSGRFE
jgi:hypothetical protein